MEELKGFKITCLNCNSNDVLIKDERIVCDKCGSEFSNYWGYTKGDRK
jgi:Zn finger protein HypA/HybF involved in hydrogenase expression